MRSIILSVILLTFSISIFSQSKSITRFRSDFKENTNMFFYSSTLKMLNTENNPEFADILNDIEEIRILNYSKAGQKFDDKDVARLRNALAKEDYNSIMAVTEKGNSISVYNREKKGKTYGIVAIIENSGNLVLIDLVGSIDINKFLKLKQKIDSHTGSST